MDYHLEFMTDERFQKLCQALLVAEFPNVQCLPVNQPDGGRDALLRRRSLAGDDHSIAFQVKFVRKPLERTAREEIISVAKTERAKIEVLKERGLSQYYLMTNVPGTSHLDVGSIDRLDNELSEILGIESHCWWRDDIERRLESRPGVRWAYPEILRGADLLGLLLEGIPDGSKSRIRSTMEAYLAAQYVQDEEVKFKQIQLQNKLLDLIVDVPVGLIKGRADEAAISRLAPLVGGLQSMYLDDEIPGYGSNICAAEILLGQEFCELAPLAVLEGAPGQGKSTITQYIAQVHRMHLLGKLGDLERIPQAHATSQIRLPIRVDLRDLASWLSGRSPFASNFNEPLASNITRSLETFLVQHIREGSGGREFSLEDFASIAAENHVLVILDGFDEVAEIETREKLVREVSVAAARIGNGALSLQMLVTSRPAAFANSPGFSTKEWPHFELKSLTRSQINEYGEKWMTARGLSFSEKGDFRRVLNSRLEQDHIRELSRNPMQLSILLTLINTKGLSLPDKRTALYDSYIDLFFGREAEKSAVVREHRDLLISLHRYLAWVLQCEAEAGKGAGSIETDRLRGVLSDYLRRNLHDETLVESLFAGMVERVVAIVSRVQGTFEFEVQPLREYFAARYLYETAPYSPPGDERNGSKPEIFLSIGANPYWLNVARFYAGCYSSGELASLVDGLHQLGDNSEIRHLAHPRQLAVMLLGDWVFAQQPRAVGNVVDFLSQEPAFKVYLASRGPLNGEEYSSLPARSGRRQLADFLKARIAAASGQGDYLVSLARLLKEQITSEEAIEFVQSLMAADRVPIWPAIATALGVGKDILDRCLADRQIASVQSILSLGREGHVKTVYLVDNTIFSGALDAILNYRLNAPLYLNDDDQVGDARLRDLLRLRHALSVYTYSRAMTSGFEGNVGDLVRHYYYSGPRELVNYAAGDIDPGTAARIRNVVSVFDKLSMLNLNDFRASVEPMRELVGVAEREWGRVPAVLDLACFSAIFSLESGGADGGDAESICDVAAEARAHASDDDWWAATLRRNDLGDFRFLLLLVWGADRAIRGARRELGDWLESLPPARWAEVAASVDRLAEAIEDVSPEYRNKFEYRWREKNSRILTIISLRSNWQNLRKIFDRDIHSYRGEDGPALKSFSRIASLMLLKTSEKPEEKLKLIRSAYLKGYSVIPHEFASRRDRSRLATVSTATAICERADEYPVYLVAWAEKSLRARVSKRLLRVGQVAADANWAAVG